MVTINRVSNEPSVQYGKVPLFEVANNTKYMPEEFIADDGYGVNDKFIKYAKPLILVKVTQIIKTVFLITFIFL